jgi:hypothetical protein
VYWVAEVEESGSNVKESRGGWWKKNKQRKKEIELTDFRVFVFPGFRGSLLVTRQFL